MSTIAAAADILFTFIVLMLFGVVISLATLAYADNELFIIAISSGRDGGQELYSFVTEHIKSKI